MIDRSRISLAPQSPGVYIFLSGGHPIYIGKSKSIRDRIKAYLDFTDTRSSVPKIVQEADDIKWIITPTEEDAIFLEQKLILENLPQVVLFFQIHLFSSVKDFPKHSSSQTSVSVFLLHLEVA